ncbi:hypothetical protein DRN72_01520 [Methanosarcinales archaeon]|nr:MAG: hypothetical protein DRN72_01520 [Methanosarcinales archaeon]
MNSAGLRFFSVYGENELHKGKYANIVSQFIWTMLEGKSPVIYGDGTQTRDFIYVGDVVRFVELLIKRIKKIKKANRSYIFNVGTGKNHSFNDVVSLINDVLGTDIKPIYVENPIKNYVYHTLADMSHSEEIVGFKPRVSLKEGIEKLISHYSVII